GCAPGAASRLIRVWLARGPNNEASCMIGTSTAAIESRGRKAAGFGLRSDAGWRRDPLLLASLAVGSFALAWVGLPFLFEVIRFAVLSPELQVAIEAAASFARIFGALVLFLFATQHDNARLRWMALALTLLGVCGLAFGYVLPATAGPL